MMMWKMKLMYHHLGLNLVAEERGLLVVAVVAVGLPKLKRKVVVMRVKEEEIFDVEVINPPSYLTEDILVSGRP
jgi:hypothetical protein